ncbi:ACT domain-containing protein [Anaerotignum sp. MB30-C6]|uniref:ACT domain-containing protein n=1 Tax=Anaerotignum sp. MB30-C6 TaxID=3070814 RepID=UPI0027DBA8CF|nr:ACT domain-containing protein [Anaerotignum sp. MB30-C6]WMI82714.1 ACT domain-containing protein [Anaerotignum sp. MB30-C6]
MEKAVITVVGQDAVGITARVCTLLADTNINILDISQTIVGGYFNMVTVVDITNATSDYNEISAKFDALGNEMGLKIRVQHTRIFDAMHRI